MWAVDVRCFLSVLGINAVNKMVGNILQYSFINIRHILTMIGFTALLIWVNVQM